MTHDIEFLLGLLALVVVGAAIARAIHVPYPIVLLGLGLGVAFIPGMPDIAIDPEVIFLVFLPPLVHAAAYDTNLRNLRRDARPIALLAVGLVAVTVVTVAVAAHALIDGMSWAVAFVLGAALAPTDTVAATAIFRRLGVPERVTGLVEGESLINDGVALVLYRIAIVAAVSGSFSLLDGAKDLLLLGTGGALVGVVVAVVVGELRKRIDDPTLEITVTLLTPYLAWIPAEELGLSGILAAVSSGLYLGWHRRDFSSASARLQGRSFWVVLIFILESLLFILIGLQFPGVLDGLSGYSTTELLLYAAAVSAVVMGCRFLFPVTVGEFDEWLERRTGQRRPAISLRERAVVGWSGMRGAVTLAAALAIPLTTDAGAPFPQRDLILFLTLCVIGATLVVQGFTLPALVKRLGLEVTETSERRTALARFRTVESALQRVGELSEDGEWPDEVVERARSMYTQRARQLAGLCRAGVPVDERGDETAWRRMRRELLDVERQTLYELRNQGAVTGPVVVAVESELDTEMARLETREAADAADAPAERLPVEVP